MTSKATPTNFNTNIDDYSVEELYNLLELEEFTREQIIISVNYLTTNVFNNNETIKEFFLNIQDKLLNYLTTYNSSFDNMLHANANSNIETTNDDISENEENEENEENNLKEGFSDLKMETDPIANDVIQPLSNFVITNVLRKKKFYFDTNQKIYSNEDPTNCKMYVQRTINVIKAKLISLTCKVPLLIHTSKLNNFFTIQKFVGPVCDFSAQIIIDDGYYEESVKMAETINVNIQKKANSLLSVDSSGSYFLQGLTFSFNYLNKSVFELSYNHTSYTITSYSIDFTSTANSYYALSNILGFTSANIINSDTTTLTVTSPKPYNTISNKLPFFFCFEDNNNSIISNYICQKANVIQSRVLARIAPLTCPQTSNILSTKFNEFNSNVLVYNGRANIENFTVKIIDIYGNILLSIDDDYCFEIEFECEELTSTSNSSIVLPNLV